jgi:hypothetical protein
VCCSVVVTEYIVCLNFKVNNRICAYVMYGSRCYVVVTKYVVVGVINVYDFSKLLYFINFVYFGVVGG